MNNTKQLASPAQTVIQALIGLIALISSLVGLYFLVKVMFVTSDLNVINDSSTGIFIFCVLAIFFVSLLLTGLSLMYSGLTRKRYDVVPGLSLYVVGISLSVLGLYAIINSPFVLYGAIALIVGLALVYVEWASETT